MIHGGEGAIPSRIVKLNASSLGTMGVVRRETASLDARLMEMRVAASLGERLLVEGNDLFVAGRSVERRDRVA